MPDDRKIPSIPDSFGKCHYCEVEGPITRDHIIARGNGGPDAKWNIVDCCYPCNQSKGRRTYEEFTGEDWLPSQCWAVGYYTSAQFQDDRQLWRKITNTPSKAELQAMSQQKEKDRLAWEAYHAGKGDPPPWRGPRVVGHWQRES